MKLVYKALIVQIKWYVTKYRPHTYQQLLEKTFYSVMNTEQTAGKARIMRKLIH
jgi:hypothetical protein